MSSKLRLRILASLLAAGLGTGAVFAQTPAPAASVRPPAPAPLNHEFDFWLGEWNVTTPDGQPAGTSRIESVAGGRALYENWEGVLQPNGQAGGNGKSLNAWNAPKKQWQQFWIGSAGGVLELAGGLVKGSMVLSGEHTARGRSLTERITWTPNADGSVRQHWEQSTDGGKVWTTVFDGHYARRK